MRVLKWLLGILLMGLLAAAAWARRARITSARQRVGRYDQKIEELKRKEVKAIILGGMLSRETKSLRAKLDKARSRRRQLVDSWAKNDEKDLSELVDDYNESRR